MRRQPASWLHCVSTRQDASLALFLEARIHGNYAASKSTARRCAELISRSKRDLMFALADSAETLKLVEYLD